MSAVTSSPVRFPSKIIFLRETIVRNVFHVPLSTARHTALGSSSLPKYFVSVGWRRTCSLNESRRRLNSLSLPIRFEGENLSGGYSRSRRSCIFLNLRGETLALLQRL